MDVENIAFIGAAEGDGISYDWTASSRPVPRVLPVGAALFPVDAPDGLAYRKRATLNWCGECQTVLANEQ